MRRRPVGAFLTAALACTVLAGCAAGGPIRSSSPTSAVRESVLRTVAGFKHLGFQVVAARLLLGVDTALAWRQLDTLLAKPTGDIFWMYPATGFYLNLRDKLSVAWRDRFHSAWKRFTPYRGDTENHFLMYYSSLLLMSQEWPGLSASEWFNGKSSEENYHEAHDYLDNWLDESARYGITEWDSPRYTYYYLTPLILLRDFVKDTKLRTRAEIMLDILLADFAAEYLNGSYCGAHSRDSDGGVMDPRRSEASSYAQLYFEDSVAFVLPDLAYAAVSDFCPPEIVRRMAHDRDSTFVHMEAKRSRRRMRYSPAPQTWSQKTDYMTPDYCLGSIPGGIQQPIQQHTWDVTFASRRPNNTLFALHPTWSATELGTFFPEIPELMIEGVASAKASYTNPDKWLGASPYEFVQQDRNVLRARYLIPPEDPVQHVDIFVPRTFDTLIRDSSGWWFGRMENAFVGFHAAGSSVIDSEEAVVHRVRILPESGLAEVTLVCGRAADGSFESFTERVRANRPSLVRQSISVVDGNGLAHTFAETAVNQDSAEAPRMLFDGPAITSETGSGVVRLRSGNRRLELDMGSVEIREIPGKRD